MMLLLFVLILMALAGYRASLTLGALVMAGFTLFNWLFTDSGLATLFALIATAALALLSQRGWRARTLTRPVFTLYKQLLPDMSDTEKTALKAGTVWWEGSLFAGQPDWQALAQHPNPTLSAEEQHFLDNETEALAALLDEWQINHDGDLSPAAWEIMKRDGFFAMIIPKEYGGKGFSNLAQSAILQKLSGLSAAAFSTVAVPNSLGPAELLLKYGTDEQKNHYLPRLADGRDIPCFALTAPRAGSDATSLPDTGVVCHGTFQGKEVLGLRLNFSKRYITLAPVATVIGLAFRMFDPEYLLGDDSDLGITVALLPRHVDGQPLEGMTIGRRHKPLGSPFMNGPIQGQDVFIPLDFIIGGVEQRGHGWKMLVECLSVGRCITLPSSGAGGSKYALAAASGYARIRRQFNVPIAKLEGVQEALARIAGRSYIANAGARVTAIATDQGEKPSVPSAILKYNITEIARQVANDSMDIHGGKGIITGPNNYLASGYASIPVAITVEGANILTRSMITFGQGAIRCHPYVLPEMNAAQQDDLQAFDQAFFGHLGFITSNGVKSLAMGLTSGRFSAASDNSSARCHYQSINRYAAAFALTVDACMLSLGGELKFRELISARLADMLSKLYLASCTLKHWQDQGAHHQDQPVLDYACQTLFSEFEEALHELLNNLPARSLAWTVRLLTLPLGRRAHKPNDDLVHKVVDLVTANTDTRERLTAGIYRGEGISGADGKPVPNPLAIYDGLLERATQAEPLYKKISQALKEGRYDETELTIEGRITQGQTLGVLTEKEAAFMTEFERDVLTMVNVDDFPLEYFGSVSENQERKQEEKSQGRQTKAS